MRALITILLIVLSFDVHSGGTSYEGVLTEYKEPFLEGSEYQFTYIFDGEAFEGFCKEITVKGFYDAKRWRGHTQLITIREHLKAMEYLSKNVGGKISFGVIGSGLTKLSSCKYLSRGLLLESNERKVTVYSVSEKI